MLQQIGARLPVQACEAAAQSCQASDWQSLSAGVHILARVRGRGEGDGGQGSQGSHAGRGRERAQGFCRLCRPAVAPALQLGGQRPFSLLTLLTVHSCNADKNLAHLAAGVVQCHGARTASACEPTQV